MLLFFIKHILCQEATMLPTNDSSIFMAFKEKKVLDIKQITKLLDCSTPTARRRLKQWQAYTSYNKNGRYYTLKTIAQFDNNGLWHYGDIFFSKYGNLKKTVIQLVNTSKEGLTGSQIGNLVGLSPRSFLSHFRNEPQLLRDKLDNQFVYFSIEKECVMGQKERRTQLKRKQIKLPPDAIAVVILVEWIKHPKLSIERLSSSLRRKGYQIKSEEILNLFEYHGLSKKKSRI